VLRSPAPVKIERVLLARDEYEKIYMTTVIKRKRWRGFDNPLFTIACAVAVAAWAAVTTPETNRQTGSARAAAKASGEKARALARTQRQAARDAAKLAKIQAKSARESARPRVYARDRRAARPPNEHFAHQPHRNIYA
jgi:threonine synthase